MSTEITTEMMNEVIARFMELGERHEEYRRPNPTLVFKVGEYYIPVKKLKYHTSWDWLMPVVEKIGEQHNISIHIGICRVTHRFMAQKKIAKDQGIGMDEVPPIAECNEYDFIGNVYKAVYQFITWYNKQKQTNETKQQNRI